MGHEAEGDRMKSQYTCAECGGVFEEQWTTEEAVAECLGVFGVPDADTNPGMVVVCDDCYKRLMATLGS